jgi:hypothetical protein
MVALILCVNAGVYCYKEPIIEFITVKFMKSTFEEQKHPSRWVRKMEIWSSIAEEVVRTSENEELRSAYIDFLHGSKKSLANMSQVNQRIDEFIKCFLFEI